MRVLVVSFYAPHRDGIANYTVQEVRRLRAEGHDVEVLSPGPSAAHHHLELTSPRGPLALLKRIRAGGYDRVVVQYHPELFYPLPRDARRWRIQSAALAVLFRSTPQLEVRVHEIDSDTARRRDLDGALTRALWRLVPRVTVHTERERTDLISVFGLDPARVDVVAHGASFQRRTTLDRVTARARLDVDVDAVVFLCIGFLQPHKGFDRALRAFDGLGARGGRLHVVGSARLDDPAMGDHVAELRRLSATTPGTDVRVGYVSDEEFDAWVVASDVVVLPYRFIWSSGVLERARLYGRRVIATDVGVLAEQAGADAVLVRDDEELAAAMATEVGAEAPPPPAADPWPVEVRDLHDVQSEVRRRAAGHRSAEGELVAAVATASSRADALARSAPLRRLPALAPAPAVSARSGAASLKRLVRKATAWQLDPVVEQANRLRAATIEALEALGPDDRDGRHDAEGGPRR